MNYLVVIWIGITNIIKLFGKPFWVKMLNLTCTITLHKLTSQKQSESKNCILRNYVNELEKGGFGGMCLLNPPFSIFFLPKVIK